MAANFAGRLTQIPARSIREIIDDGNINNNGLFHTSSFYMKQELTALKQSFVFHNTRAA